MDLSPLKKIAQGNWGVGKNIYQRVEQIPEFTSKKRHLLMRFAALHPREPNAGFLGAAARNPAAQGDVLFERFTARLRSPRLPFGRLRVISC